MIPVKHIDPDDLALYAMQLLPPDEAEEMSLHLQHSAEARRVLSEIYSDLSIFAHSAEMHSPPALARQRLMKHVAREKKAVPVDPLAAHAGTYAPRANVALFEEEVARRSVAARVLPWVGWALAASLGAFAFVQYQHQDHLKSQLAANTAQLRQTQSQAELANTVMDTLKDPLAVHFSLTGSDQKPPPQGRVTYVADKGSLVLTASNLNSLPPYKTYELWLIPTDAPHTPIPAGTFHPDERGFATVILPELPKGVTAAAFGVTIEDGDGSQTPTMPIILKGTAS
jgi:anti-sigma-K factor RskA